MSSGGTLPRWLRELQNHSLDGRYWNSVTSTQTRAFQHFQARNDSDAEEDAESSVVICWQGESDGERAQQGLQEDSLPARLPLDAAFSHAAMTHDHQANAAALPESTAVEAQPVATGSADVPSLEDSQDGLASLAVPPPLSPFVVPSRPQPAPAASDLSQTAAGRLRGDEVEHMPAAVPMEAAEPSREGVAEVAPAVAASTPAEKVDAAGSGAVGSSSPPAPAGAVVSPSPMDVSVPTAPPAAAPVAVASQSAASTPGTPAVSAVSAAAPSTPATPSTTGTPSRVKPVKSPVSLLDGSYWNTVGLSRKREPVTRAVPPPMRPRPASGGSSNALKDWNEKLKPAGAVKPIAQPPQQAPALTEPADDNKTDFWNQEELLKRREEDQQELEQLKRALPAAGGARFSADLEVLMQQIAAVRHEDGFWVDKSLDGNYWKISFNGRTRRNRDLEFFPADHKLPSSSGRSRLKKEDLRTPEQIAEDEKLKEERRLAQREKARAMAEAMQAAVEDQLRHETSGRQIFDLPLYVGGAAVGANEEWLRNNTIGAVVNLSKIRGFPYERLLESPQHILHVDVDDSTNTDLLPLFPRMVAFIHEHVTAGRRVLVHCSLGKSRSPSGVLAYLVAHHGVSLQEAFFHVSVRNRGLKINDSFLRALRTWECTRRQIAISSLP